VVVKAEGVRPDLLGQEIDVAPWYPGGERTDYAINRGEVAPAFSACPLYFVQGKLQAHSRHSGVKFAKGWHMLN